MDSKTHIYITKKSLELINDKFLNSIMESIVHYSTQPDYDENEGSYNGHFYNPSTGKNFTDGYDSALSRFYRHYTLSITTHSNTSDSAMRLGRGIHYLEDLCTPVHTYNQDVFDATVNLSSHILFENRCNDIVDTLNDNDMPKNINKDYFINNNIKDIGVKASLSSSVLFNKYYNNKSKKEIDSVAKESIINGIKNTMGILYRYLENTGRE